MIGFLLTTERVCINGIYERTLLSEVVRWFVCQIPDFCVIYIIS